MEPGCRRSDVWQEHRNRKPVLSPKPRLRLVRRLVWHRRWLPWPLNKRLFPGRDHSTLCTDRPRVWLFPVAIGYSGHGSILVVASLQGLGSQFVQEWITIKIGETLGKIEGLILAGQGRHNRENSGSHAGEFRAWKGESRFHKIK
jgi:hypothetical protein